MESQQKFQKLRRSQQVQKQLDGYVEWICKAEEAILGEERTTEEEKMHIMAGEFHTLIRFESLLSFHGSLQLIPTLNQCVVGVRPKKGN